MRILILGGAGTIGAETVRDLIRTSDFSEVVVGEVEEDKAKRLISELRDPRLSVMLIDATDEEALSEACKGFSVIASTLPFRYDLAVTRAAIKARVRGIDVFTTKYQLDLTGKAEEAGVTYVVGCGMSPGVSNVLARKGANTLDETEEVGIAWASYRCLAPAPGLLYTTFWEFDPDLKERTYYEDGKLHPVRPFSGGMIAQFPEPIGVQEVYYVPHPETFTLPRFIRGIRKVEVRGTWPPETMRFLRVMLDFGFYKSEKMLFKGAEVDPKEFIFEYMLKSPEAKMTAIWGLSVIVQISGTKDGVRRRLTYVAGGGRVGGTKSDYARYTGVALSIGAQLLANGRVKRTGVLAPEVAFEPDEFIAELKRRNISVFERKDE